MTANVLVSWRKLQVDPNLAVLPMLVLSTRANPDLVLVEGDVENGAGRIDEHVSVAFRTARARGRDAENGHVVRSGIAVFDGFEDRNAFDEGPSEEERGGEGEEVPGPMHLA